MARKDGVPGSVEGLSSLDVLLAEEGRLEAFEAVAIQEVRAWQGHWMSHSRHAA